MEVTKPPRQDMPESSIDAAVRKYKQTIGQQRILKLNKKKAALNRGPDGEQ